MGRGSLDWRGKVSGGAPASRREGGRKGDTAEEVQEEPAEKKQKEENDEARAATSGRVAVTQRHSARPAAHVRGLSVRT